MWKKSPLPVTDKCLILVPYHLCPSFLRRLLSLLCLLRLIHFLLSINSTRQSRSWQADSRSACQEICRLLWNRKSVHCVHNGHLLKPIWTRWIQSTQSYFIYLRYISIWSSHLRIFLTKSLSFSLFLLLFFFFVFVYFFQLIICSSSSYELSSCLILSSSLRLLFSSVLFFLLIIFVLLWPFLSLTSRYSSGSSRSHSVTPLTIMQLSSTGLCLPKKWDY